MPEWGKTEFDRFYRANIERWGRPGGRPAIVLGYHYAPIISAQMGLSWGGTVSPNYPQLLFDTLGLVAGDAVLIVGCGFNGTGQGLTNLGIRVIGAEISSYVQGEKANTEEAEIRAAIIAAGLDPDTDTIRGPGMVDVNPLDLLLDGGRSSPQPRGRGEILDEELRVRGSRNAVRNRFDALWPGTTPRYILTEEVLNSITDAEADLVCDYAASAASEWGSTVVHMLSPLMAGFEQDAGLNWKNYAGWRSWLDTNGYTAQQVLPTVTAEGQGMTLPAEGSAGRVVAYSGVF